MTIAILISGSVIAVALALLNYVMIVRKRRKEITAAVAKVCLKPGDPCDPDGVFNE